MFVEGRIETTNFMFILNWWSRHLYLRAGASVRRTNTAYSTTGVFFYLTFLIASTASYNPSANETCGL